jgi:hypothetical protein
MASSRTCRLDARRKLRISEKLEMIRELESMFAEKSAADARDFAAWMASRRRTKETEKMTRYVLICAAALFAPQPAWAESPALNYQRACLARAERQSAQNVDERLASIRRRGDTAAMLEDQHRRDVARNDERIKAATQRLIQHQGYECQQVDGVSEADIAKPDRSTRRRPSDQVLASTVEDVAKDERQARDDFVLVHFDDFTLVHLHPLPHSLDPNSHSSLTAGVMNVSRGR